VEGARGPWGKVFRGLEEKQSALNSFPSEILFLPRMMVKCILHLETPTKQPGSSRILYSLKVFLKKEGKTQHFQVTERSQLLIEAWGFWVFWLQPGAGQEPRRVTSVSRRCS